MTYYNVEDLKGSKVILTTLLIEHTFAYASTLFRAWEVDYEGKLDVNGIMRGPKETILKSIEVFVDCIIVGYSINFVLNLSQEDVSQANLSLKWIIIDNIMMICTLAYVYFSNIAILNSEITKNMFSLYFFQEDLIRKKSF